jgi:hypothetical protein
LGLNIQNDYCLLSLTASLAIQLTFLIAPKPLHGPKEFGSTITVS